MRSSPLRHEEHEEPLREIFKNLLLIFTNDYEVNLSVLSAFLLRWTSSGIKQHSFPPNPHSHE